MTDITFNSEGLVPVVVQDAYTNEVLMLAYANQEAYDLMLSTGYTHFWSRSRKMLWKKGETSGHVQKIVAMQLDCDADTLLVRVEQESVACHLDRPSCFEEVVYGDLAGTMNVIPELKRVIAERRREPNPDSYTSKLLADEDKRLKKVVEEAGEVILAFKGHDQKAQAWEVSDLIYHLMVVLEAADQPPADIYRMLAERRGHKR